MNSATESPKTRRGTAAGALTKRSKKPRAPKRSGPYPFDDEERKMIEELVAATDGALTSSEIQRAAVRYAVPRMLSGEAPIRGNLRITPTPN